MLKLMIFSGVLFFSTPFFSQELFNRTYDFQLGNDGLADVLIKNDTTALIEGFTLDSNFKRKKILVEVNMETGDTIGTFKYGRDSVEIYGGFLKNIDRRSGFIYSTGSVIYNSTNNNSLVKINEETLEIVLDTIYFQSNLYSRFDNVVLTEDSCLLIIGQKEISTNNADLWIVKIDLNGNLLWSQTYGYSGVDGGINLQKTKHNNNYYFCGFTDKNGIQQYDIYFGEINPQNGALVRSKVFQYPYSESGAIKVLQNGEVLFYGGQQYSGQKRQALMMRLDTLGEIIWSKYYLRLYTNFPTGGFANVLELDGQIYTSGITESKTQTNYSVGFFMIISSTGDSLWYQPLKIRDNDHYIPGMELLSNSDFLISGYVFPDSQTNTEDGWLMRVNCLGYFNRGKDSSTLVQNNNLVLLTNQAQYFEYTTVSWGDGSPPDTLNDEDVQTLSHNYTQSGNYTISVTTVACNDTLLKNYTVNVLAPDPPPSEPVVATLTVFPNPSSGVFTLAFGDSLVVDLRIVDVSGRLVEQYKNIQLIDGFELNLSAEANGVYFLIVDDGIKPKTIKLVKG